ncbi:hypothetical protein AB0V79_23785 [Mesorhizobium ciceri]|uniref:hypothetical protein n=1 Tax=Mesorhizobium ciceri TaxID=39645 RepID=UPI0014289A29|nr:hypothetical protein [Mesorhizobium ciceri]
MAGIDGELSLRRNYVARENLARHKPGWALVGTSRLRRLVRFLVGSDSDYVAGLRVGGLCGRGREEDRLSDESRNRGNLDQHGGKGDLLEHARKRFLALPVPPHSGFRLAAGTRDRQCG